MANGMEGEMVDLMATCAMLVGRPRDAAALLLQLTEAPRPLPGGQAPSSSVGSAPPPTPPGAAPLRLSLLAVAWQCAGEYGLAAAASASALAAAPKLQYASAEEEGIFWVRRGHLLVGMHRHAEAFDAFQAALASRPNDVDAHEGLLWARYLCDHFERASAKGGGGGGGGGKEMEAYAQLVSQHPWHLRMRVHYTHALWRERELFIMAHELGIVAERAATAQPTIHGTALAFRALSHLHNHRHGAALTDLEEASVHIKPLSAATQPLSPEVRQVMGYTRGTCLLRLGDYERAVYQLGLVDGREHLPKAEAIGVRLTGGQLVSKGDALSAAEAEAVERSLESRRLLLEASRLQLGFCASFNLGLAHWRVGRPVNTLQRFVHAQQTADRLARVTVTIRTPPACASPSNGAKAESTAPPVSLLRWPMVGTPPLSASARPITHVVTALVLHRLARVREATAHYDAALRLQPDCLAALVGHGDLHLDSGNAAQARRSYCRAAVLNPMSPTPHAHLARLAHHLGQEEEAKRLVTQALQLSPRDPDALEARAVLRLAEGDAGSALNDLTVALGSPSAPPEGTCRWKSMLCTSAACHTLLANRKDAMRLYATAVSCLAGCAQALLALGTLSLLSAGWSSPKGWLPEPPQSSEEWLPGSTQPWSPAAAYFDEALAVLDADASRYSLSELDLDGDKLERQPSRVPDRSARAQAAVAMMAEDGSSADGADGVVVPPAELAVAAQEFGGSGPASGGSVAAAMPKTDFGSLARQRHLRGRAALGSGVAHLCLRNMEVATGRILEAATLRNSCGRTAFDRAVLRMVCQRWEEAERDLIRCVQLMPMCVEAWLRKCQAIVRQDAGRKKQVLIDYANALLIADWQQEQRQMDREARIADQTAKRQAERQAEAEAETEAAVRVASDMHRLVLAQNLARDGKLITMADLSSRRYGVRAYAQSHDEITPINKQSAL